MRKLILVMLLISAFGAKAQTVLYQVKKQVTIETRDFEIIKLVNSPRWFKTKSGIYRVSIKLKDRAEVENKILYYLNRKK